jgi:hypothetical protein
MQSIRAAVRIVTLSAITLLAGGWARPATAADESWWQRIDGYASIGTAHVRARPDNGGTITASFNDSGTVDVDKSLLIAGGRNSSHYLPIGTVGARFRQTGDFTWGLELQGYSFSDTVQAPPRDAPGTTPLANFSTFRETGQFKMDGSDITATASYSRWNITAEGQVGLGSGTYFARSELYSFGVFTTGNFINLNLSNGTAFKGDGLVYGLRLAYAIPQFPLQVLARYKHSKLDGKTDAFGSAAGSVASSPSAPLVGAATVTRNDADATGKLDTLEYGLQYDFSPGARTSSFVSVTYTDTSLKIRGLPTGGAGFGGTIGTLTTNSFAQAGMASTTPMVGKARGSLKGFKLTVGVGF